MIADQWQIYQSECYQQKIQCSLKLNLQDKVEVDYLDEHDILNIHLLQFYKRKEIDFDHFEYSQ